MKNEIQVKLETVTDRPGVYLMINKKGNIIYVGKAKNLKKRLSSYFQVSKIHDGKTGALVRQVVIFDTIITATEKEAFILESNLIKKHKPRYNIVLKDDKRYPLLKINVKEEFPYIKRVRKIEKDGSLYFGPFSSSKSVNQTLKFIDKNFKLRKCKKKNFEKRERPCLNYQMKICDAPCCNIIDKGKYRENIHDIKLFLKGKTPELINKLKNQMQVAAETEKYELAAILRDRIFAIEKTLEKQLAVSTDRKDRDVLALVRSDIFVLITIMFIKNGYLVGKNHFVFTSKVEEDSDVLRSFIKQYYDKKDLIPEEILINYDFNGKEELSEIISEVRGKKVNILFPQRGDKLKTINMAVQNAEKELDNKLLSLSEQQDLILRVKDMLLLERVPSRIECFDNSNISGTNPVAGMVVFIDGKKETSLYRKYKIKSVEGHDDYAYMNEVLTRRFRDKEGREDLPDLLMVDGGKGQLSIALNVIEKLNLSGRFDIVGIAKKDETKGETADKIYKPARLNPILMAKNDKVLFLLQRVRDESHRFAITYHRKKRGKKAVESIFDTIKGIGKAKKNMLIKHFGGIGKIAKAEHHELVSLSGINDDIARDIKKAFNSKKLKL